MSKMPRPKNRRRLRRLPSPRVAAALLLVVTASAITNIGRTVASTPSTPSPLVIRVRTVDGSVIRVPVHPDGENGSIGGTMTLSSVLAAAGVDANHGCGVLRCRLGIPGRGAATGRDLVPSGEDGLRTVADLGLQHGSMITVLPPPLSEKKSDDDEGRRTKVDVDDGNERYDPFPDLAKSTSYSAASRRARALSRGARGTSYGDISRVRSAMHVVEPQPTGPLTRVYVCRVGAAKFQNHCISSGNKEKKKEQKTTIVKGKKVQDEDLRVQNRAALLFGTVNTERVDQKSNGPRTSLSTPRSDQKMCEVAKVHAVWGPPGQTGKRYNEDCLVSSPTVDRAIRVAGWLGLRPLGWIFSYDEDRHDSGGGVGGDGEEGSLPVHGRDVVVGSQLQIEAMKRSGRDEGRRFITLAQDGRTGATEAFQLSDVCVQMVAEGVLAIPKAVEDQKSLLPKSNRFVNLKDPVVVSGDETKSMDSVLFLVNTAMLSHVGSFSGGNGSGAAPSGGNVKRASGAILAKTKKRILSSLLVEKVPEELCDFDILLALDLLIGEEDSERLCKIIRKYVRGQKKGTELGEHLKLLLQSVLGG